MRPTYVSFYTGPGYAEEAEGLRRSLAAHDLPHWIEPLDDTGAWVTNCAQKPAFLRRAREHFRGPLVWLDADARVVRPPTLFDTLDCDVAGHWFKGAELLSSALYFADTEAARQILDAWCAQQERNRVVWDQKVLQHVLLHGAPGWRIVDLPAQYSAIFDAGIADPVIVQGQASRRLKRRGA